MRPSRSYPIFDRNRPLNFAISFYATPKALMDPTDNALTHWQINATYYFKISIALSGIYWYFKMTSILGILVIIEL